MALKNLFDTITNNFDEMIEVAEENGKKEGYSNGYEQGSTEGYNIGYEQGSTQGYEQGYDKGHTEGNYPIYCMWRLNSVFKDVGFSGDYELFIHVKSCWGLNYALAGTTLKSIKIKTDEESTGLDGAFAFRSTKAEVIDLSEAKIKFASLSYAFYDTPNLKSIFGELDFSDIRDFTATFVCPFLEDISIVSETIKVSVNIGSSKLTKTSLTSIINGLSSEVTGQTLALSRTAVDNAFGLDTNDGSYEWDTLIAPKDNWTITLG